MPEHITHQDLANIMGMLQEAADSFTPDPASYGGEEYVPTEWEFLPVTVSIVWNDETGPTMDPAFLMVPLHIDRAGLDQINQMIDYAANIPDRVKPYATDDFALVLEQEIGVPGEWAREGVEMGIWPVLTDGRHEYEDRVSDFHDELFSGDVASMLAPSKRSW